MPRVRQRFGEMTNADLLAACERAGLPFAPITKPEHLFDDPHLNDSGGLTGIRLADGRTTKVPALPFEMDGRRFGARLDPPAPGSHTRALLAELGYDEAAIRALVDARVVVAPDA
jgi:crotonobetainyl-CoA:carnitine CoA-transferase CaiB-like acyl-CoA transferase